MQLPSTAEQKPHVLVQCEQRNLVASQLGGGVPTGKGWRPKQGFSMGQLGSGCGTRSAHSRPSLQVESWQNLADGEELLTGPSPIL